MVVVGMTYRYVQCTVLGIASSTRVVLGWDNCCANNHRDRCQTLCDNDLKDILIAPSPSLCDNDLEGL